MFDFPGGQAAAFCATFAVGWAGYVILKFLRVPNPAMLGSMAATGALSAVGFYPSFDTRTVSFVANIMIGVMLGRLIDRTVVRHIARMVKPVLIQTVGMIALSLICGLSMYLLSGADIVSSLISGAAGGIAEMIIFGMSVDADVSVIAFVQLFRVVAFLALIPYLGSIAEKITGVSQKPRSQNEQENHEKDVFVKFFRIRDYLTMVPLAFAGGALAFWLKIPTGTMLGAMFVSGGMALFLGKRYRFDDRLCVIALVGIGLVTGERITPEIIGQLRSLLVPTILMTLIMLAGCTLLAALLYKTTRWNLVTCLLSVNPAGLTQVVFFAEDMGADLLTVSVFQTVRLVGIVTLYPWLILPFISSP